ncbi:MAG: carboxypeptidase-like regulatory domain-containing protein [Bacteroidetes bacterium]|nr:carboxypeptidase-like regulatory domain-containing protein [Bacteroidota bacterium]
MMKIIHTRISFAIIILLFLQQSSLAQAIQIKGTVRNELDSKPVPEANISVYGTRLGTSTDRSGRFDLQLPKLPSTIIISCIGYEKARYVILHIPGKPLELVMRPAAYNLKEVEISSAKHSILYEDKSYSVLDYELMDDNVALLVFRNVLKQSEFVLLGRSGDTLAAAIPPELPPGRLYKDFLDNVHYYSKAGYAWQCYYDTDSHRFDFLYPTPVDSLEKVVGPFLFRISGRLYFQEKTANGFGTMIGYYSKGKGKQYIKSCLYEKKIFEYFDDQRFYLGWNGFTGAENALDSGEIGSPSEFDFSIPSGEGGGYGKNELRAHKFEYFNMIFPLIKLSDQSIAFFNFGNDLLEILDPDGKSIRTVPISFHKDHPSNDPEKKRNHSESSGWRWGTKILTDGSAHTLYTIFLKNGMVKIQKIDPLTGNLSAGTILPFLFPEKIKVYKGEAFFLCKDSGGSGNWKLVKCKVD